MAFLLVDNTGSGTFGALERLPHLAGRVENLGESPDQVDRLCAVLAAEVRRRDRALREAGDLPDITAYDRRLAAGQPLAALPRLLVAIDEFDELATAWPALLDACVEVGRAGGRLGMHLLLAAQRVQERQLRGLAPLLSYRLGLRTFDPHESQALLGVPDAAALPPVPGTGLLRVGARLGRFRAVPVSVPYRAGTAGAGREAGDGERVPTVLDTVVGRLREHAAAVPRLWLPPLPTALPLHAVAGPAAAGRGPVAAPVGGGYLRVPVGLVDRPDESRQEPFVLDLSGGPASTGHLWVLGGRRAGKSTLLCTLVTAAALTHTPDDVRFVCVDGSDGALAPLAGLPHVAAVAPTGAAGGVPGAADRDDAGRVREAVGRVELMLAGREALFAERGIADAAALRRLRREGALPELPATDVVLVIDDFAAFAAHHPDLFDRVNRIGARGPAHGVHLVLAAGRPAEVPDRLRAALGGAVELALTDPRDSAIDVRASARLPVDTPGRCLIAGPRYAQVALPGAGTRDARSGLAGLVATLASEYSKP
jgi:S-DNA-T family DNA segregation ATPase FtsK/SpoIIIE